MSIVEHSAPIVVRRNRTLTRWLVGGLFIGMVALVPNLVGHAGEFHAAVHDDFDCDGKPDAVHVNEIAMVDEIEEAGAVTVTYSSTGRDHQITQAMPGIPGTPESGDWFGEAHTAYDRDQDGCHDLVIGVPQEDIGSAQDAGPSP